MARRLCGLTLVLVLVVTMVGAQGAGAADDLATNKAVATRFYEIINSISATNTSALDDVLAANLVDHNPVPGQAPGLAGFRTKVAGLHAAFPDVNVKIADVIAE